jgi:hypothetical protein
MMQSTTSPIATAHTMDAIGVGTVVATNVGLLRQAFT